MKNKKSLGQNWLKNREILDEIALEAVSKAKICVEIGPGLGTLTSSLLKQFDKVIAVEFDENLAKNLPKSFPGKNLEVINADILNFDFTEIKSPFVVAGNIPYYITSPIIEKLITLKNPPEKIVLLVQKEVADRITSEKSSVLSLKVKNCAFVTSGITVDRSNFTPVPKVESKTIIMTPHAPVVTPEVLKFITLAFKSPRKKLLHNLSSVRDEKTLKTALNAQNLNENARPADLTLENYRDLYNMLQS